MPAADRPGVDAGIADRDRGGAAASGAVVLLGLGVVQAVAGVMRHRFAVFNWLSAAYRTVQVTVAPGRTGSAPRCPSGWPPARW